MFQKTWVRMAGVVILAIVLVALLAIPLVQLQQAEAAPGAQNIPCYREQGGAKVVGGSGCEYEFQSGSTLDVQSGASFNMDAVTIGGDITLENGEGINNSTDGLIGLTGGLLLSTTTITVTDGQTITPTTYSVYNLDSAGAVTITLAACTEGQWLVLAGDDANDITIADSNIRTDDGGIAVINQYDMFIGVCIDAEWLQVANPTDS